jgi:hypothetical protein
MRGANTIVKAVRVGGIVLGVLLVGGLSAGSGAVFGLLTRDLYVPILVPLAMGASVGAILGMWVFLQSVRRGAVVILVSVIVWGGAVITFHWVEYRVSFMQTIQAELNLDVLTGPVSRQEVEEVANVALERGVGSQGFLGFLRLRARSGVRWRLSGKLSTGYLPGVMAWVLDVLVGALLAIRVAMGVRKRLDLEATAQ